VYPIYKVAQKERMFLK